MVGARKAAIPPIDEMISAHSGQWNTIHSVDLFRLQASAY